MLEEMLRKKAEDKRTAESERIARNDADRNKILENVSSDLSKSLQPVLADLAKNSKLSTDDIRKALAEAIQITMPEVKMPEIKFPEFKIPTPVVNVPAPIVNIPKTEFPKYPDFPGEFALRGVNNKSPLPVMLMDLGGKPFQFPVSMGGGGKADFFTISDIRSSASSLIDQTENALRVTGNFTVSSSATSTLAQLVNADGNYYSSDNPLPTTASVTLSAAVGQGDGATALRTIQAGDTVSSVYVNNPVAQGDSATALRVIHAGNASMSVTSAATGLNETTVDVVKVAMMTDVTTSTNVTSFNGTAPATGLNENTAGVLKVAMITSVNSSVNVTTFNGNTPAVGTNETNVGVLRVVQMSDTVSSVYANNPVAQGDSATALRVVQAGDVASSVSVTSITGPISQGDSTSALRVVHAGDVSVSTSTSGDTASGSADAGNPVKVGGVGRITNPTAVADGQRVNFTADKLGRQISRPVQVRDLLATAYTTISNGTETTILTAAAGTFLDCIWMAFANTSSASQNIDIRAVSGGNIIHTIVVPANGTAGWAPMVPWPQDATGNAWTADGADVTNSTLYITSLFSKET